MDRIAEIVPATVGCDVEMEAMDQRVVDMLARYSWVATTVSSTGLVTNESVSVQSVVRLTEQITAEISGCVARWRVIASEHDRRQVADRVRELMAEARGVHATARERLKQIAAENEAALQSHSEDLTLVMLRENVHWMFLRGFRQCVQDFGAAADQYKAVVAEDSRRQLMRAGLEDQKAVEEVIQSGRTEQVLAQALSGNMTDVLASIRDRHQSVVQLERDIAATAQLFADLAAIVDLQQESIDTIEARILKSKSCAKEGVQNILQADKDRKTADKCKWYIVIIVVVALVVILAPVLSQSSSF